MVYLRRRLSYLFKKLFKAVFVVAVIYMMKNQLTYSRDNLSTMRDDSDTNHKGTLNLHRWNEVCGFMVDSLRVHVSFPYLPSQRSFTKSLNIKSNGGSKNFGQMIFGFIRPPSTGFYRFAISSDDSSELWLSPNNYPNNASLIGFVGGRIDGKVTLGWTLPGEFKKLKHQISHDIYLKKDDKYFIEVLHKQATGLAHLLVKWKLPESKIFVDILSQYMEEYPNDSLPALKQHEHSYNHTPGHYKNGDRSVGKTQIPYLRDYHRLLPTCNTSSEKLKLKRYQGVKIVHKASVYPDDGSDTLVQICAAAYDQCQGNPIIAKKKAYEIVEKYLNAILPKRYSLKSIITLEEFKSKNSSFQQFFVDIEVIDKFNEKVSRIAEPVWQDLQNNKLCNPGPNSWNSDVMVHVIVTAKNQGLWLRHFIDTIEHLQEETNDHNIHPIIVDFGSTDVGPNDTEIYLERSKLKHYTVIHKNGRFYKTIAINEAAASVKDENSILFQLDLHLDLPVNLIDTVRKHTIQSRLAFTPFLLRLSCGSTPNLPIGYWEDKGYGLFAVYKSDWSRFGGMNVKEFGGKWGGEDWEMVDRVLMNNISIQSIRMPGLFHFYHNRDKLWQNAA